ncbi:MAG: lytic murein transglycosylase [Patescibacteria group bacterium]|mgnify:CR=1 FL=1
MRLPLWGVRSGSGGIVRGRDGNLAERVRKVASVTVMSITLPVSLGISGLAGKPGPASDTAIDYSLNLNLAFAQTVTAEHKISQIAPGESVVLREKRFQLEAKEKARAEAETRARAEAETKAKIISRGVIARDGRSVDPADFSDIYRRAGAEYGVDPRILEAVHYVETGRSGSTAKRSYAGAIGPMQFMPGTFRRVGVDGNGDGTVDITNVEDAIFSAAKYLRLCGYPDVDRALWGYNPSKSYNRKVMTVASSLGYTR